MSTESDTSRRASPWHPVSPTGEDVAPPSASPEVEDQAPPVFDTHGLTPAKPPLPSAGPRPPIPTPIEAEEVEVVPAVTLPDAAETFPVAPVTSEIEVGQVTGQETPSQTRPTSPYLVAHTPKTDAGAPQQGADSSKAPTAASLDEPTSTPAPPTGSVRKVRPSAAALLAVGELPTFEDGVTFVPRYEPVRAKDVPPSPLAHATLDVPQEPAYTPIVPAPSAASARAAAHRLPQQTTGDATASAPGSDDQMTADSSAGPAETAQATAPSDYTSETDSDAPGGVFPPLPPVDGDDDGRRSSGSFWTSAAFLTIVGIIVMAVVGFGTYALFFKPADVALPSQTILAAPADPSLSPVTPTDPSSFLAAMPTTVGSYALTDYTSMSASDGDAAPGEELPEGVAEQLTLTYSDGTDQIVVDAWQSYTVDGAQQVFDGLNVGGTEQGPVVVDGQDVGVQVHLDSGAGPTVLWTNATAVFSATGDNDSVYAFVDGFGF